MRDAVEVTQRKQSNLQKATLLIKPYPKVTAFST